MNNKKVFKTTGPNGNEMELATIRPTPAIRIAAQLAYNKAWKAAETAGSPLRRNLDTVAENHGIWGEKQRKQVSALETEILSLERKLRGGANSLASLEEAKECALQIRKLRSERMDLLRSKDELDAFTCENFADTARLNYLVAMCTVRNEDKQLVFKSYEDFISQSDEKIAVDSFINYMQFLSEDMNSGASDLYENTWLLKHGFVDEKFRLINADKHLIDSEGRLINEEGFYVTKDGGLCDKDGNPCDKDGNYQVEYAEFS